MCDTIRKGSITPRTPQAGRTQRRSVKKKGKKRNFKPPRVRWGARTGDNRISRVLCVVLLRSFGRGFSTCICDLIRPRGGGEEVGKCKAIDTVITYYTGRGCMRMGSTLVNSISTTTTRVRPVYKDQPTREINPRKVRSSSASERTRRKDAEIQRASRSGST